MTLSGDTAEVVAPAEDGEWIRARFIASPLETIVTQMEDLLFISEIERHLE